MRDDALGEAHVPVRDIPGEAHEVSARNLYGFTDRPGSESAADHVQVMQRAHPVGFDNVGDLGRLVQATARDVSPMTIESVGFETWASSDTPSKVTLSYPRSARTTIAARRMSWRRSPLIGTRDGTDPT
jgi:hypothetical protein